MRIASYNLWNNRKNFKLRLELLVKVIVDYELDVIVLQEVKDESVVQFLSENIGLKYYCWQAYPDCEEGLAIISKYL